MKKDPNVPEALRRQQRTAELRGYLFVVGCFLVILAASMTSHVLGLVALGGYFVLLSRRIR